MGFEVLHGIVDCLWVIGEPISVFKEAVERETGILTEVDTYDWITFLPMSDGSGAYNRYTGIYIPLQKENEKRGSATSISMNCGYWKNPNRMSHLPYLAVAAEAA